MYVCIMYNMHECILLCIFNFLKQFEKILVIYFSTGGRVGEREGEKHRCVVASHASHTGNLARNQACALNGN